MGHPMLVNLDASAPRRICDCQVVFMFRSTAVQSMQAHAEHEKLTHTGTGSVNPG